MKKFDVIVSGVGGQGVLTLAAVIARAALLRGYEVKGAELHGLAMRFGSLNCHLRFGKKVWSPLVTRASADLIIGLEPLETLRACIYAYPKTKFLLDTRPIIPNSFYLKNIPYPELDEILAGIRKFSSRITTVDASDAVEKITGNVLAANIYLLGHATAKNMIPLEKVWLVKALAEIFSGKVLEMNKRIFELGFKL
jgi:indolepyruvate ferredoxin oxidoreductase beta subunit